MLITIRTSGNAVPSQVLVHALRSLGHALTRDLVDDKIQIAAVLYAPHLGAVC